MPGFHNALALKAAPQASVMAHRTAWHMCSCVTGREGPQVMVPGQARSSSQGMSSWDTSTAEAAAHSPLRKRETAATYLSAAHLREEWKQ